MKYYFYIPITTTHTRLVPAAIGLSGLSASIYDVPYVLSRFKINLLNVLPIGEATVRSCSTDFLALRTWSATRSHFYQRSSPAPHRLRPRAPIF
jgi:hypothetical protein